MLKTLGYGGTRQKQFNRDLWYIGGLDKIKGSISMRVFDALGRTVIEPTVVDDKGLNVISLPSGTYFYQLQSDETAVLSGSFIKE